MYNTESLFTYQAPIFQAEYHDPPLRSYQGNPLIETLPPISNRDQVYRLLQSDPGYDAASRQWPSHLRLHLFLEAARFFQPLNIHFDLEQRFSRLIRSGYVGRNPLDLGFWSQTEQKLHLIRQQVVFSTPRVPTQGFTLMGMSGTGKSRTIERILSLYPQVIQHREYCGRRFTRIQLVWLKLECPYDGSVSGLCHDFFQQVDMLLGTNHYENHGLRARPTIDKMRVAMARVASNHSLGVLIIDEIQNLRHAKSEGADKMLSFLVQLDNTIGVPLVFVGTPKARAVLAGEFRRARRAAGQGDLPWERMRHETEKDSEWRVFLETLWKYQYVRKKSDLTDELSEVMYDESQGIADIAIKLYFLAQIRAIERKTERVTADIIRKTAEVSLRSVQEPLHALRSDNKVLLQKYEDIQPIDLEGAVWQALREIGTSPGDPSQSRTSPASEQAPDEAKQKSQTIQALDDKKKSKERATQGERGLIETVTEAREHDITVYDALKKGGFIRDAGEYLGEEVKT
jgi:AAA domain